MEYPRKSTSHILLALLGEAFAVLRATFCGVFAADIQTEFVHFWFQNSEYFLWSGHLFKQQS